ncbi:MAG: hypothetical protein JSR77_03015 [Planctomycetes bacterium]|nr:hypothetical protein [Planctomycetota bacterium]
MTNRAKTVSLLISAGLNALLMVALIVNRSSVEKVDDDSHPCFDSLYLNCMLGTNAQSQDDLLRESLRSPSFAAALLCADPSALLAETEYAECGIDRINKVVVDFLAKKPGISTNQCSVKLAVISRLGDTARVTYGTNSGWFFRRTYAVVTSDQIRDLARRWLVSAYGTDHEYDRGKWITEVASSLRQLD